MHEGTNTAQPRAQIFIKRPRLTKLLDEAGGRILLLLAPAGYGKTTLGREWTAEKDRVGWYAGGHSMADVAALSVGIAETLGAMGDPPRDDMVERVRILAARGHDPRGLAKAVSTGAPSADWLLVVDDYHYADGSADAEAFFEELVGLTDFRLLIATRERPKWLAARRVVYGEVAIVEMDALAFTHDEARAVLGREGSDQLLTEARGWPAVIGLAAMRGATDVTAGLNPDDLYRFFAEDLFQRTPARLREAMFRLALAGDAGVEGARELLGGEHKRLLDGAAERGYLLPEARQAVHPLLRGFLLTKLAEDEGTEVRPLIAQVVEYLADQKRWDECLFVLERLPQEDLILSVLQRGLAEMLDSGRITTVSRWLELAVRKGSKDPLLLLAETEVALRRGDDRKAQALGEIAGGLLEGDLAARAYVAAARAAHMSDDAPAAHRLCELALGQGPEPSTRMNALWTEFNRSWEQPDSDISEIYSRLETLGGSDPTHRLRLQAARGLVLCNAGDVRAAIRQFELGVALLSDIHDPFARTNVLQFMAYSYLLSARYEETVAVTERLVVEARESGLEFVIDHALLRQAGAYVGMRRFQQAQRAMDALQRRGQLATDFVLDNIALQQIKLAIGSGNLERARTLLAGRFSGRTRPAFRAELGAYRSIVSAALGDVDRAMAELRLDERWFRFLEPAGLRDVARVIIGINQGRDPDEQQQLLDRLFNYGHTDPIVTGYRAYPPLAELAAKSDGLRPEVSDLLARSHDGDIARKAGIKVPRELRPRARLSPREQDVYELLIQGRANHEIARSLFISESTVKVHIRHIFDKLGVHTRAEAARIAASDESS